MPTSCPPTVRWFTFPPTFTPRRGRTSRLATRTLSRFVNPAVPQRRVISRAHLSLAFILFMRHVSDADGEHLEGHLYGGESNIARCSLGKDPIQGGLPRRPSMSNSVGTDADQSRAAFLWVLLHITFFVNSHHQLTGQASPKKCQTVSDLQARRHTKGSPARGNAPMPAGRRPGHGYREGLAILRQQELDNA